MGKRFLLVLWMACLFWLPGKAEQTIVNVPTAGTLKSLLATPLTDITDLKVTGTIDARDFKTIRDDLTNLVKVDLSGITIAAFSGSEGTATTATGNYLADAIPQNAFYVPRQTDFLGRETAPEKKLNIQEIQLPAGIKIIGDYAMAKLLKLSSTVLNLSHTSLEELGNYAFYQDSTLTEIKLPSSVKTIKSGTFQHCVELTSFTVPSSTTTMGSALLQGCSNISEIKFESPSSLTSIGYGFFSGMPKLMKVEIPASVTSLTGAFTYGNNSFMGNEIVVDPANPNYVSHDGMLYNKAATSLILCPPGKTSASIPSSTQIIETDAFRYTSLTTITIPKSVKTLKTTAFAQSKLEQVSFETPASLETIERQAFWRDTFLVTIHLPEGVKTIGDEAFNGDESLKNITFPSSLTSIGNTVFAYSGIESVDMSGLTALTNFGVASFRRCEQLTSAQLPPNNTTVPSGTFDACTALKSLTIPAIVTTIGSSAFAYSGLESITLPEGLIMIGSDAFNSVPMPSITIPKTVTTIGMGYQGSPFVGSFTRITVDPENPAFSSLDGILYDKAQTKLIAAPLFLSGSFTIPNTVKALENFAFFNDTLLTSIELPAGLETIGNSAFRGCYRLKTVKVKNPVPITIADNVFYDAYPVDETTYINRITANAILCVPAGAVDAYKAAAYWKDFVNIKEPGFFYGLDYESPYPNKMSPNGKYVVGSLNFLWENKGNGDYTRSFIDGGYDLVDVNDAGAITGKFLDPNYKMDGEPIVSGGVYKNGRWYSLGLGRFGSPVNTLEAGSAASAITQDGWVFGMSGEKNNVGKVVPMVWKPNATTGEYTDTLVYRFPEYNLPAEQRMQGARILDASSDGSIACGWAVYKETHGSRRPIIWTSPTEYEIINPHLDGEAGGVSPNGKYVSLTTGGKAAIYDIEKKKLTVFGIEGTRSVSVSNDGTIVGYKQLPSDSRKGFLWSDKLGYIEIREFIDKYLPEITLPEGFTFDEPAGVFVMDVPMSISGDGLTFAGWRGAPTLRRTWIVTLPAPLDLVERPHDLEASVDPATRNKVQLSWSAPAAGSGGFLDFYKIYRNNELIYTKDANEEDPTSYTDENAPAGYVEYTVSALYSSGKESGKSDPVVTPVVDNYDLPFYDGFQTGYRTQYWETTQDGDNSWTLVSAGFVNPTITGRSAMFFASGNQSTYSHTLTSRPLDAREKDKITASFTYQMAFESDPVGVRDTIYFEVSNDIYGTTWNTVEKYVLSKSQSWTIQSLDISELVTGKLFRARFRAVSGANRNLAGFIIDEFAVATGTIEAAKGVKAQKTADGKVEVVWQDPSGSYALTYSKMNQFDVIGNAGVPFIGANRFKADTLTAYKELKLTSITAYINGQSAKATVDTKLKLAVFVDGNRVNSQNIESFKENGWNTFLLDNPVAISGVTRELAFGIEVVEHDTSSMPLAIDVVQTVTGWGDAYSEDNGQTWETLTSWKLPYSWSIIGNVRAESAAIERVNGILGYEVYRDGEKLNSGSTSVTSGQTYVDNTNTAATPCYSVRAYYAIGGLSVMSDTGCLADDVAIETISASEPVAYPNPTTGKVYIRSDANQAPEIIVSDLVGERLLHTRGNSVDLSKYANGIYLLQVNGKVVKITKK